MPNRNQARLLIKNPKHIRYLILAVLAFLLFCRVPMGFLHPQFWAEDGTVFFQDQYNYEGLENIFKPSAGYLHVVPRLIAYVASYFDHCWAPTIFFYLSFLIILLIGHSILSDRLELKYKPALVLSLAIFPCYGTVLLINPTNIIWFGGILLIVTLMKCEINPGHPGYIRSIISDHFIILMFGLSGTLVIPLCGAAILRLLHRRTWASLFILLNCAFCAATQIGFILSSTRTSQFNWTEWDVYTLLGLQRWIGAMFIPNKLLAGTPILFLMLIVAAIVYYLVKQGNKKIMYLLIYGLAIFSISVMGNDNLIAQLSPNTGAYRYFFVPQLMLLWALLNTNWRNGQFYKYIKPAIIFSYSAVTLINGYPTYYYKLDRYQWRIDCQKIDLRSNKVTEIPIAPDGWVVRLNPK